ncbi:MAG: carbohydrate ABC transporter permease [Clostridiaceae bacterium]
MRITNGRNAFNIFNYTVMILFCMTIILPFLNIIAVSLSGRDAIIGMKVSLWPKDVQFEAYKEILTNKTFTRSLINTIGITAIVTFLNILLDVTAAYAFTKKFFGKTFFNYYFIITMYFSGGLIPFYLLMTNYLHLKNSYLALILPALVNVFYIIVIRSQIETIPKELIEAGVIDGAKESQALFMIIVPSIMPTIAAISMFIALGTWNSWFNVMLFTNIKEDMWMLQYYLRAIVFAKTIGYNSSADALQLAELGLQNVVGESYQMAAIILVALPVVAVYPFVQKYFVKGILVGSVKG